MISQTYEGSCCMITVLDRLVLKATTLSDKKLHPGPHYSVENACCEPMVLKTTRSSTVFPI